MDGSAPNNLNLVAFSHVNALNIAVVFGPWHVGKESMQIAIAPRPTHTHTTCGAYKCMWTCQGV